MQYIKKITLKDSELIALKDAISVYKSFIESKIGNQVESPYWARLQNIKKIEEKIQ